LTAKTGNGPTIKQAGDWMEDGSLSNKNYIRIPKRICAKILCSEAALGLYHKNTVNVRGGCVHRTLKLKLNNNDGRQCGGTLIH
jgi:hypothetical protein